MQKLLVLRSGRSLKAKLYRRAIAVGARPRSLRVFRRHPEPPHRVALEIELDHHGRFVADHPAVVPRLDSNRLRSRELHRASIGVLNMDLPLRQEPDVGVLAEFGPDDRLHVPRPAESQRVDHSFDPTIARAGYVELDASDHAMVGSFHRCGQGIGCHWRALQSLHSTPDVRAGVSEGASRQKVEITELTEAPSLSNHLQRNFAFTRAGTGRNRFADRPPRGRSIFARLTAPSPHVSGHPT